MVAIYGMSEKLGYLSFLDSSNPYLGGPGIEKKYGEETANLIDHEVKAIVNEAHRVTRQMLLDNRDKLEKMATELLRREVLSYKDIEEILGKRPNLDDSYVPTDEDGDVSKSDSAEVGTVSVQPDIASAQLPDEERKALEAAVEKLKSSRKENRS
jgi:cell division protease FtsH